MKIWNLYKKFLRKLLDVSAHISGFALFLMMAMVAIYIVVRKTIGAGGFDATELSGYLMVIVIFLGMGYTFREGGFLRVEVVYDLLPAGLKKFADMFQATLGLVYCYLLTRYSIYLVVGSFTRGIRSNSTYRVLLFYPQMIVVIGSILLSLAMVEFFGDSLITLFSKHGDPRLPEHDKKNFLGEGGNS